MNMPTIKSIKLDQTTDGKRRLARVVFTPRVPDPSNQYDVEAIFEVIQPDVIHLEKDLYAVAQLSVTRVDTREVYTLSDEQRSEVIGAAIIKAAEDNEYEYGWV